MTNIELVEETLRVGRSTLSVLRPRDPEALLDEEAFARDEFLPYWAELWPASLELAGALPARLEGAKLIELGCGLGIPSLVAANRGADVVAVDWANDAVALLRRNAVRNGVSLAAVVDDWRTFSGGAFDIALAADVLYEQRNVEPLLDLLPRLASEVLLATAGRPYEQEFLRRARELWRVDAVVARVHRLTRTAPADPPARADA
jgi:predicted nicotinamide N-methyase